MPQYNPHKTVENIQIGPRIWKAGPFFLIGWSRHYLDAALRLPQRQSDIPSGDRQPFDPVPAYLVCHSLELAFKAFLCLRGVPLLDLSGREYGHGLATVLSEAKAQGLDKIVALSEQQCTAIRHASQYYEQKLFEYPSIPEAMGAYSGAPRNLEPLTSAATLLCSALWQPCLDSANE